MRLANIFAQWRKLRGSACASDATVVRNVGSLRVALQLVACSLMLAAAMRQGEQMATAVQIQARSSERTV
ncbi:MAG: hypothetical protein WDO74_06940 [Pseudomonadota bacterium]